MSRPKGVKNSWTAEEWAKQRIQYYWERKRTYEATKRSFEDDKYEFTNEMDRYFDVVADEDGKVTVNLGGMFKGVSRLICQKISQVKVEFDTNKLRKVLDKKQQRQVIQKHYQVNNWPGLLKLLKDSGVEWSEFLKYVDVSESVRENVLEQLVELGEVDAEKVKKCSSAKIKTQYYKVTEK